MLSRKRVLSILSILLILSFVLSACGTPAPAPATVAPAAPTAAPVEPTMAPEPTAAPVEPTMAPQPTAAPEATAAPTEPAASAYKEAPMLAALVQAGTLPAIEERLPKSPYVITAPEVGKYGGTCGAAASSARPTATASSVS
jgi:hypothetical protein